MKTINIKNAYPGFANGHIVYEGSISTQDDGVYGDNLYSEYKVYTEIKNNLVALIICNAVSSPNRVSEHINYPIYINQVFILPYQVETQSSDKSCTVIFRVPYGCVASYRISGDKNLGFNLNDVNKEVEITPLGFEEGFAGYGHKHDGIDAPKLNLANVKPTPGNAGKFVKVSSDGTSFIYENATGAPGSFSLSTPAHNATLDMQVVSTLFNWTDSAGATSYRLIITSEITDETILDEAGILASQYTVLHSLFEEGKVYNWNVIATNGTETTTAVARSFRTNIITDS